MESSKNKNIFQTVISLGIGIVIIFLFFKKFDPEDIQKIKTAIVDAKYGFLVVSICFTMLAHVTRTMTWQSLLAATGEKVSFGNAVNALFMNYLVNLGIPRAGEIARCVAISKTDKVPVETSFGTVVSERIVDLLMLVVVGIATFLFQYDIFINFYNTRLKEVVQDFAIGTKSIVVAIAVLLALTVGVILLIRNKKDWFKEKMKGLMKGIMSLKTLESPAKFIAMTLMIWLFYWCMTYSAFICVVPPSELPFLSALSILFFGTFGFIVIQGGLGVYPILVSWVLLLYGVSEEEGVAAGWIMWFAQTALILITGLFASWYLGRKVKFSNPEEN